MGRVKTQFPRIVDGEFTERVWMAELYPDSTIYKCDVVLKHITEYCDNNNIPYGYILHDKDFNEDGEIKKSHYHIVMKFENPRRQNALSTTLEVPYNYLKCWDDFNKAFQYLIHKNDKEKYQYSIDEIHTNINNINDILYSSNVSEEIAIQMILDFINNYYNDAHYIDIQDVMQFALKNHIYTHLRRSGSLFSCLFAKSRYYERK